MKKTGILIAVALVATFAAGIFGGAWLFSDRSPAPMLTMADAEEAYALEQYAKTFEILLPLAKAGEPTAQYRVGMMLNSGRGVERDVDEAIPWLRRAVISNVSGARDALGSIYVERAKAAESVEEEIGYYHRAADIGSADAQAVLGSYYLVGQGVPPDYDKARSLLELAAGQNDPRALSNLGYMYASGTGVERDDTRAFGYYREAAELGLVRAQAAAGLFLETGRGVEKNLAEATRWLLNAAAAGDDAAAARLGALIASKTITPPTDIASAHFVKAAAANGNDEALGWLQHEAGKDNPLALGRLAEIYLDDAGIAADEEKGLVLLQRAADAGDALSQIELSRRYGVGNGLEQDYVVAHQWANIAASSGNVDAIELRANFANLMTPQQIESAQARAREWAAARAEASKDVEDP